MHFAAPKVGLPGHAESYNPPAEYLFDEDELRKYEVSLLNQAERMGYYCYL